MNNLNLKNVMDQLKVFSLNTNDEKQIAVLNQINKIFKSLEKMNKDFEKTD